MNKDLAMNLIRIITGLVIFSMIIASIVYGISKAIADEYSYQSTVSVTNVGDPYTGRISVTVPADALIDGGFLQADGDDMSLSTGEIAVMSLDQTSATWTFWMGTVPTGSMNNVLYTGSPGATARDQAWQAYTGDTITTSWSPCMDIEQDLIIRATVSLSSTPTAEREIVSKEYSYELCADATNWIFRVWEPGTSGTETAQPNAGGMHNEWTGNYTAIDEDPANDADFIQTPTGDGSHNTVGTAFGFPQTKPLYWESYGIPNFTLTPGAAVDYFGLCYRHAGSDNNETYVQAMVWSATNTYGVGYSSTMFSSSWGNSCSVFGPDYGRFWNPWSTGGPGDETFAFGLDQLDNIEVGFGGYGASGANSMKVSYAKYYVGYTEPGTVHQVTRPIAGLDTEYDLVCTYDGVNIAISDGSGTNTAALTGDLHMSGENLEVGGFHGSIDDVIIEETGSAVISYDFDAADMDGTTIEDQVGGCDLTFTLASSASVTAVLDSLVPASETQASGSEEAGAVDHVPEEPDDLYAEDSVSSEFGLFGDAAVDVAGSVNITPALVWTIVGTIVIVGVGIAILMLVPNLLIAAFAQGVLLFILFVMGILTGWIALVYPFMAAGLIVARRAV